MQRHKQQRVRLEGDGKMKQYLSYGGGVNSTALLLHFIDHGVDFEAVFANHETDLPETYEYVGSVLFKANLSFFGFTMLIEICLRLFWRFLFESPH